MAGLRHGVPEPLLRACRRSDFREPIANSNEPRRWYEKEIDDPESSSVVSTTRRRAEVIEVIEH